MSALTRGKLAKAAQVNVETLRYYEKRGLLPEPPRAESGYRLYPVESIERVSFIKGAQELGFTLVEIKDLLDLRIDPHGSKGDVKASALAKVTEIDEKIKTLTLMRNALVSLADQCSGEGELGDCPILEAMETHTFEAPCGH